MRYPPFDRQHGDLSTSDLEILKEVREGWYVEYKSQLPTTQNLAKSLSSFANQHGGLLFLGVDDDPESLTAASFPGIANGDVPRVLESLRNASKDIIRPQVVYQTRELEGPNDTIGLEPNRSVIVVHIPEGPNTPYIHNDGRIYIRIGDSSSPISAKDKATFDLLYQRGEDRRSYLKTLIDRSPELSEGEGDSSFIHLSIVSDPYQMLGHWYEGTYSDFCTTMSGLTIPFDNIYTAPGGFIARQVGRNAPYNRLLTWEFSRNCNSFVTIPLTTLPLADSDTFLAWNMQDPWEEYVVGQEFKSTLISKGLESSRVLNLNILLSLISVIVHRHRIVAGQADIRGPFYIKARIENVWRTVPFIDLREYIAHLKKFDFPVVQTADMIIPPGASLESFVMSPELAHVPEETDKVTYGGPIDMWLAIMQGLGLPGELLSQNATAMLNVSIRESELHRAR